MEDVVQGQRVAISNVFAAWKIHQLRVVYKYPVSDGFAPITQPGLCPVGLHTSDPCTHPTSKHWIRHW